MCSSLHLSLSSMSAAPLQAPAVLSASLIDVYSSIIEALIHPFSGTRETNVMLTALLGAFKDSGAKIVQAGFFSPSTSEVPLDSHWSHDSLKRRSNLTLDRFYNNNKFFFFKLKRSYPSVLAYSMSYVVESSSFQNSKKFILFPSLNLVITH